MRSRVKIKIICTFFTGIVISADAQENLSGNKKERSLYERSYDYFSMDYEFLDDKHNIVISDLDFQELVNKYSFYPERIRNYKDSLTVILTETFPKDPDRLVSARFFLSYSWSRLSYHLWLTPDLTEDLAKSFGINHPFIFKRFLIENDTKEEVRTILNDLKSKMALTYPKAELVNISTDDLLSLAMRSNPQRNEDFAGVKKSLSSSRCAVGENVTNKSCGKENCCQLK